MTGAVTQRGAGLVRSELLGVAMAALSACAPSIDGNWTLQLNSDSGLGLFAQDGEVVTGVFHWEGFTGQVSGKVSTAQKDNVTLRLDYGGGAYLDVTATTTDDRHLDGHAAGTLPSISYAFLGPDWKFFPVGGGASPTVDAVFTAYKPP